jgi:hypothetical protein
MAMAGAVIASTGMAEDAITAAGVLQQIAGTAAAQHAVVLVAGLA